MNTTSPALQARRDKAAQYAQQVIVVNEDWRIVRADAYNWEVRYKGQFKGYYGRLMAAFQALPAKMLDATVRGTLEQILEQHAAVQRDIDTALKLNLV